MNAARIWRSWLQWSGQSLHCGMSPSSRSAIWRWHPHRKPVAEILCRKGAADCECRTDNHRKKLHCVAPLLTEEMSAQHPQLPRVAAGVGALAFGFGLELLRRNLLTRLAKPVRATPKLLPAQSIMDLKDALTPQSVRTQKLPKGYEIQETAIYISRVIRKVR